MAKISAPPRRLLSWHFFKRYVRRDKRRRAMLRELWRLEKAERSSRGALHKLHMTPPIQAEFAPWSISYPVTFALFLVACGYFRGWLRLRNTSPNLILPWQAAAFISRMFAVWLALCS